MVKYSTQLCYYDIYVTKTKTITATAELSAMSSDTYNGKVYRLLPSLLLSSVVVHPDLTRQWEELDWEGDRGGEAAGRRGKQIWTAREDPVNGERGGAGVAGRRGRTQSMGMEAGTGAAGERAGGAGRRGEAPVDGREEA